MTKEQINKYLINRAVDKMTEYLIQDYNTSIEQALDFIYNSDTYQKLTQKETGLYIESPDYTYQLLDQEYKTMIEGFNPEAVNEVHSLKELDAFIQ